MAAKDARIVPIYNCKHREYIELVDSGGAAKALADGDTELSKDGAAFADSAVEMSEISTGFCSLDFPYSEMAYKCVVVVPKSTDALTRVIKLFPQRLPVLRSGTAQAGGVSTMTLDASASAKDGVYVGCLLRCSNNTPAGVQGDVSKIIGYVGETKIATVADAWTDTPTSSTTFEVLVPSDMSLSTLLTDAAGVNTAVEAGAVGTAAAAIQAVTDVIPDAGALTDLLAAIAAIKAITDVIPDAGALTALLADIASILDDTGTAGVVLKAVGLNLDAAQEIATQVSTQLGILKNSTVSGDLFFTMRDSTNHALATGKTVSGQVNIDGAGFGAVTGAITELALGWYKLAANATDRNGDMLLFHFTAAACDPTLRLIKTGS